MQNTGDEASRLVRVGILFLVGVTLAALVWELPGALREHAREARANSALSFADREIAGGNAVVADQQAVYQARARIPESGTFLVDVAADYSEGGELTVKYVADYYRYILMPRRPAPDAEWVICYGCDLGRYGEGVEVVWRSEDRVSIARVPR
jgi:hypothetical protein